MSSVRETTRQKLIRQLAKNPEMASNNLSQTVNLFWGKVTAEVIQPSSRLVHQALKERGITEQKPLVFNDMDDKAFPVETTDPTRRVFVHTTQSRDYLYILNGAESYGFDLHIRRIHRPWTPRSDYVNAKALTGSFKRALANADKLLEFDDDHAPFAKRHSLAFYRAFDFQVPFYSQKFTDPNIYGDARDDGYILSYRDESRYSKLPGFTPLPPRVEGSMYSHTDLTHISEIHLSGIAMELGIPKLPSLKTRAPRAAKTPAA